MTTMTPPTGRATTDAAPGSNWRDYATCRETDPELFFPTGMGGQIVAATRDAKRVCQVCPVQAECRQWAVSTGERNGVWGGLSEDELRSVPEPPTHEEIALQNLAYIREQMADGVSMRQVATDLGIGHWGVRRALKTAGSQNENEEVQSA